MGMRLNVSVTIYSTDYMYMYDITRKLPTCTIYIYSTDMYYDNTRLHVQVHVGHCIMYTYTGLYLGVGIVFRNEIHHRGNVSTQCCIVDGLHVEVILPKKIPKVKQSQWGNF